MTTEKKTPLHRRDYPAHKDSRKELEEGKEAKGHIKNQKKAMSRQAVLRISLKESSQRD